MSYSSFLARLQFPFRYRFTASLVSLAAATWGALTLPGMAIETIKVRVGPLTQNVQVNDLEFFTNTGQVPNDLQIYSFLLTPQVQQALQTRLMVDSDVGRRLLEEFLDSPGGGQLLETLRALLPNLSDTDLVVAFEAAAANPEGLSIFGMLESIPQETLEIDVATLLSLISQLNLSRLENEALSRVLEQELRVQESDVNMAHPSPPTQPGNVDVEQWHLTLHDRKRDRSVPVDLYWNEESRGPLVIISHGFAADRHFYAYLSEHLASHGLTVASVEHSGSNVTAITSVASDVLNARPSRILPASEFIDRPRDISFVLDRLERLNQHSYSLKHRINTEQVLLIGHSLGGYTGLALAGAPLNLKNLEKSCYGGAILPLSPADWLQCAALDLPQKAITDISDDRITRLLVMNPLTGHLFSAEDLNQVKVPTLMLASSRDQVTPVASQQLRPFTQLGGPKSLVMVVGGSHLSVGDPDNLNPELKQVPFMPEVPGQKTQALRSYMKALSLSFALQETEMGERYRTYLTPAYAQSFSSHDLQLRLSHDLPPSITAWLNTTAESTHRRNQFYGYFPSLFQLESISLQRRLQALRHQMVTYLRTSPPSITALYLPRQLFRTPLHAVTRRSSSQR